MVDLGLDLGYKIISTQEKGRCLIATRKFSAEDVIFKEKPIVAAQFCWNQTCGYLACAHCLRPLESAEANAQRLAKDPKITLPYPECCGTRLEDVFTCRCGSAFCSQTCFLEATPYHEVLCMKESPDHPLKRLIETWKEMHYPPESCSIMLIAKILTLLKRPQNREEFVAQIKDFCNQTENTDLRIFHKLLGENFAGQLEKLFVLTRDAFPEPELAEYLTPEGFKTLFALIGRNGQGIGTCSFSTWSSNVEKLNLSEDETARFDSFLNDLYNKFDEATGLPFLDNEGSGLYVLQSKTNHSCEPNAEVRFPYSNFVLELTATKDIAPGEEICISYLDECNLSRSRHSRQKILKENYLFVCQCKKCQMQVNDPNLTSEEEEEEENMSTDESS